MSISTAMWLAILASLAAVVATFTPASAQQQKPNIVFIMGDDIGWIQVIEQVKNAAASDVSD